MKVDEFVGHIYKAGVILNCGASYFFFAYSTLRSPDLWKILKGVMENNVAGVFVFKVVVFRCSSLFATCSYIF